MEKRDILEQLISHYANGNKAKFATLLGVSPQSISTWLARNTFDVDKIYANCVGVSGDWLLTGVGSMLKSNEVPAKVSFDPSVGTPYYDVDFIGGFNEIFNNQTTVPACNVLVPGFEKASVWCNVTGHSMEPKINHGDIIALHECSINDIQYGEIYAVVLDTIRTIKILRRGSTPDVLRYVPINQDYDEQEFDISRIIKVFEVIGAISKFF